MDDKLRTVIGFDSWVGGASNFSRLVPELRKVGYRLVLIHIGSWGGDEGRPKIEQFEELEIRDISYYEGKKFDQILKIENPVAVLFLSNDVFAHRAFNRYAILAGIPTIHLYHGLVNVQALGVGIEHYKVNFFNQLRYVAKRIPKAFLRIWPSYARALYKSGAGVSDWLRFLSDVIMMARGRYIAIAAPDSKTSAACVYTLADVPHAIEKYGYSIQDVYVVGNPDLSSFGLSPEQLGSAVKVADGMEPEIIYIDTGLIYAGMVFDNEDDYFAHINSTRELLFEQNLNLSIKLHPDHFRTKFPERLRAVGIEVLNNQNFLMRLQKCRAALVEPSTASLIPALVGLPIFLVQYGKLAKQSYGPALLKYPRARHLHDVSALSKMLADECIYFEKAAVFDWIEKNAGPLPPALMPRRVAEVVREIAENRTRRSSQN